MRIQLKSIVTAFALLSLVSGAIGCRSNGGPWYNPKSYAWQNPFSSEAPPYESDGTAHMNRKPSLDAQANVSTPPGGYAKEEKGVVAVQPQYGYGGSDASRVASTENPAYPAVSGIPGEASTDPYGASSNPYLAEAVPNTAMPGYQQTRYHEQQNFAATQQPQPGAYQQQPNYGETSSSSFAAVPQETNPMYGGQAMPNQAYGAQYGAQPATTPVYGAQPTATPAYGAQPTATPAYGTQPAATPAYGAQPAATPAYGTQPATTPAYGAQPSGFEAQPAAVPAYGAQPTINSQYGNAPANYGVAAANPYNVDANAAGSAYGAGGYTANPSIYPSTATGGF